MTAVTERTESRKATGNATVRYLAAVLAFASQAVHLWILPDAVVITLLPGAFFLAVAVGQGLLGVSLLFGPGRWALRLGIALNSLVVAVWLVTRVLPLPELTGIANPSIGILGIAVTIAEAALVLLLLRLVTVQR